MILDLSVNSQKGEVSQRLFPKRFLAHYKYRPFELVYLTRYRKQLYEEFSNTGLALFRAQACSRFGSLGWLRIDSPRW